MVRALLVLQLICSFSFSETVVPLFTIQRSLNANEVHYELNMKESAIDAANPISVYWILNAKDGSREELTRLEKRKAYGFQVKTVDKDLLQFILVPLPNDIISVKKDKAGLFIATVPISGKESKLETIFVQSEKAGPIPRVKQIELRGKSLEDGAPVLEKRKFK